MYLNTFLYICEKQKVLQRNVYCLIFGIRYHIPLYSKMFKLESRFIHHKSNLNDFKRVIVF